MVVALQACIHISLKSSECTVSSISVGLIVVLSRDVNCFKFIIMIQTGSVALLLFVRLFLMFIFVLLFLFLFFLSI